MLSNAFEKFKNSKESFVLIFSVFIAGLCSIIYELLIGTASSYFLGDSVKQFSMTIGFYMASMGIGSYLSRFIKEENILLRFISFEILLGFVGGISVPLLYISFAFTDSFVLTKNLCIVIIGIIIGLEVPLLTRLMDKYYELKLNISNILSLDYFGALIATMLFPFILLPYLGTFKSSLIFGLINMTIGFVNLAVFKDELNISKRKLYFVLSSVVTVFLITTLFFSNKIMKVWHQNAYEDRVVFSKQSKYQSIVITKHKKDIRMYLNGGLQFSSIDEYRYHEPLVHIPMSTNRNIKHVLVLGGGDGIGLKEIIKYKEVETITLVDLDPEVISVSKTNHYIKKLNKDSLKDKRVKILNIDAFVYLTKTSKKFDLVIADLPDPNNISLARLYSYEFYKLLKKRIKKDGLFITQATSPFFAKKTFWCINETLKYSGFKFTYPLHVNVPSFGEWGFIFASINKPINTDNLDIKVQTRFLDNATLKKAFLFEKDLLVNKKHVSFLESPKVLSFYLSEWKYWN
jgi:spermidine synthase